MSYTGLAEADYQYRKFENGGDGSPPVAVLVGSEETQKEACDLVLRVWRQGGVVVSQAPGLLPDSWILIGHRGLVYSNV